MQKTPRLRMFAGPNGSGKSTMNSVIHKNLLGFYVNADELEKKFKTTSTLDFSEFRINTSFQEVIDFLSKSELIVSKKYSGYLSAFKWEGKKLIFPAEAANSYFASVLADFIRHKLLDAGISFTFETVMSHVDKIDFLAKAQRKGFRTYLYFVATDDPEINIKRVAHRVRMGGHPVPRDKIIERYFRTLGLLSAAIKNTNRAYIFDNSGHGLLWLAEITNGAEMELKNPEIPDWFIKALPSVFADNSEPTGE
ncbi:MAG: zeta toxin family protein [Pseudomonas sp.]